jgi:hypothetical protein
MKIVIGKFSNPPFHALSKKEVSLIFKLVPTEWAKNVSCVVLSSKIFKKTKLQNPVEYITTNQQLSVFSRGLVREDIARQVLLELATIDADLKAIQCDEATELEMLIKPYMHKFLKARI